MSAVLCWVRMQAHEYAMNKCEACAHFLWCVTKYGKRLCYKFHSCRLPEF